jgi:hypothetical protein
MSEISQFRRSRTHRKAGTPDIYGHISRLESRSALPTLSHEPRKGWSNRGECEIRSRPAEPEILTAMDRSQQLARARRF